MEVHPPHSPLHTWRDFFIHIATITIGLLIAIGLEQSVELLHHRHIVHQARENIRHEIEANNKNARANIDHLQENADRMKANLVKAREFRDRPGVPIQGEMHFTFSWEGFSDSAWRSARDSGALTYMPIAEVQRYDDAYEEQQIVDKEAVDIFTHQSELAAPLIMEPDASGLSREEAQTLMHDCAVTQMRLVTVRELTQELAELYTKTLKE